MSKFEGVTMHLTIYALCWLADWADARGHVELTRWADNRINLLTLKLAEAIIYGRFSRDWEDDGPRQAPAR